MSLIFYKLLHILGLLMLFAAMGGAVINAATADSGWKKLHGALHGIGAFLLLLGGFGMLARLGIMGTWPGWVWGKLAIWLVLGAAPFILRKAPEKAKGFLLATILLGFAAAYLALYKPF
ncbi:MAG: hypothetical protein ACI9W4_001429 [Rhodothermales bacterium]|jgi:hypothetical protein